MTPTEFRDRITLQRTDGSETHGARPGTGNRKGDDRMKSGRQGTILRIISEQSIETQNQLMDELKKRGIDTTQATLSRDIRELRLVKQRSADGTSRYAAAEVAPAPEMSQGLKENLRQTVTGVYACPESRHHQDAAGARPCGVHRRGRHRSPAGPCRLPFRQRHGVSRHARQRRPPKPSPAKAAACSWAESRITDHPRRKLYPAGMVSLICTCTFRRRPPLPFAPR